MPVSATANDDQLKVPAAFGMWEDPAHPPMLDLRLADGSRLAYSYAYLVSVIYRPDQGIHIAFASDIITITGRNLEPLYRGLLSQRVEYIQAEHPRFASLKATDQVFVLAIQKQP